MATYGKESGGLILIALLAIVQAVAGILRAARWIHIGSDLSGRGVLFLPIIGAIAMTRGVIVGTIAVLFGAFALGVLAHRSWARGVGLAAVIANTVAVLSVLLGGAPLARTLVWMIVPVIVIVYLLQPARRSAPGHSGGAGK